MLLRLVLTLDAVLTVACQIVSLRGPTSAEGATCLDLMNVIDEEVILQLGMMADAALGINAFVRECDKSDLD